MKTSTTEEQDLLRDSARRFLEANSTEDHVRAMEIDPIGWSPDLWVKMARLGWHGLLIPESEGGSGLSMVDLAILAEEAGRALLPGPFLSSQSIVAMLSACATEPQRRFNFPKICGWDGGTYARGH